MTELLRKDGEKRSPLGRVHSIQSMGTVDGPGIRFVVFLKGCHLRCGCCHNPDTWEGTGGTLYAPDDLAERALRYKAYFGERGGVTVSGGEPLLQAAFTKAFFAACHARGLHTCLDTSGSLLDDSVKSLLEETDRILLDIKYTTERDYRDYVGCGMDTPLAFLALADERGIPVTLRQVIIPTLNDTEENARALREIATAHACVDSVELLPFRKICTVKYENMGIPFRFGHLPEPEPAAMERLNALLRDPDRGETASEINQDPADRGENEVTP